MNVWLFPLSLSRRPARDTHERGDAKEELRDAREPGAARGLWARGTRLTAAGRPQDPPWNIY
ncbi:hypothetical protein LEMLEM_LOCUS26647 [Lemmus lemmus]